MSDQTLTNATIAQNQTITVGGNNDGDNNLYLNGTIDNHGEILVAAGNYIDGNNNPASQHDDIRIASNVRLTGGGSVVLSETGSPQGVAQITVSGSTPVTLENVDNTISGAGSFIPVVSSGATLTLVNDAAGTINANDANTGLRIYYFGTAQTSVTNRGLIEATAAGGLQVYVTTINQNATGKLLASGTGHIDLDTVTINGGTLQTTGAGVINVLDLDGGGLVTTLDGTTRSVTIATGSKVNVTSQLNVAGTITNRGTISFTSGTSGARLGVAGPTVLNGGGTIALKPSATNTADLTRTAGNPTSLENVDNKIVGAGEINGLNKTLSLKNDAGGLINANGYSYALLIDDMNVANDGLIEGIGRAGLKATNVTLDQTGGGKLLADGNGHVDLDTVTIKGGTLQTTNGGVITVLAFNGGSGTSTFDGRASQVVIAAGSDVDVRTEVDLEGTLANAGTVTIENGGKASVVANTTLRGGGDIDLRAGAALTGGVFTLDNLNETISGAGSIAGPTLVNEADGTIRADAGAPLVVSSSLTNHGLLQATGAGVLRLSGAVNKLAGTIGGSGTVDLAAGADPFYAGTKLQCANLHLSGANVTLSASLSYGGTLEADAGTLDLSGNTLTLSRLAYLDGTTITGGGILNTTGSTSVRSDTSVGARVSNSGNFYQRADLSIGNGGYLTNGADAKIDVLADVDIASARTTTNAGLIEKTGGTGTSTISGAIANSGSIEVDSGTLDLTDTISGTGSLDIEGRSTLELGAIIGFNQTADFGTGNGTLKLDAAANFHATIDGFGRGDSISLTGFDNLSEVLYKAASGGSGGTLTVTDNGQKFSTHLDGSYRANGFDLVAVSGGEAVRYTG